MGALRRHLIWVVIPLLVAAVILPATAQDTGTTADDPFVFFTPGLALTDRDTSHDKFFNSIDTTLVIPFGPNVSAMGTYSLQFKDTPRWTAVGNYDWFATDDLTVRAAGGIFSDEFGARLTAYKPGRKFGTGVRAGVVSGDLEVGGFLTTPFTWGFPLRKQRMGDRINGRMRVADLGASTAVAVSIRGGELDIGTEPEYFYPRNEDWARFAQGAQGTAATQTALAPRLHQVWSTRTGAAIRSSAAIADSTAYVGSDDGYFYALNLDTGELRWRYWLGSPVASSPAVEGGRVVVGCDDGSVYCFSRTADKQLSEERVGEQIWRFRTKGAVVGSPLITVSGLAIFGSRDGSLYAVDTRTAKLKWQHQTDGPITASPIKSGGPLSVAIADKNGLVDRDVVFCASEDGYVYALGEHEGKLIWRVRANSPIVSTPALDGQQLYVATQDGRVMNLTARNGREVWTRTVGGEIRASLTVTDKRVVVATRGGRMLGLNPSTGEPEWVADLPAEIESTPAAVQGKALFVGGLNGHIYAVNRSDGNMAWDIATGDTITASPAIAYGKLVCGSHDGVIYGLSDRAPKGEVVAHNVATGRRPRAIATAETGIMAPIPDATPTVTPPAPAWKPPPGWLDEGAPTTTITPAEPAAVAPQPIPVPSTVGSTTGELRMQLIAEPADAAELPIQLVDRRDATVAWGTTAPTAEVDGQIVHNQDGRVIVRETFDGDGTFPVTMITGKGTRNEHIACRLVIVDTTSSPASPRAVAFSPDADGVGDTIAFQILGEGSGVAMRVVEIRDSSGTLIRAWQSKNAGESTYIWDGADLAGKAVAAGNYTITYELKSDTATLKRMTQGVILQRAGERIAAW